MISPSVLGEVRKREVEESLETGVEKWSSPEARERSRSSSDRPERRGLEVDEGEETSSSLIIVVRSDMLTTKIKKMNSEEVSE